MARMNTSETAERGGRNEIEAEGTFHLIVQAFDSEPVKTRGDNAGERIDGWLLTASVLDGTARSKDDKRCTQAGKQFEHILWNPKPSQKDQGDFCRKKQTRLAFVTGMITSDQLGKNDVAFDDANMIGRQLVGKFTRQKQQDGSFRIDLSYSDLWHVDDPEVEHVPMSKQYLDAIPKENRMSAEEAVKAATTATSEPTKQGPTEVDTSAI